MLSPCNSYKHLTFNQFLIFFLLNFKFHICIDFLKFSVNRWTLLSDYNVILSNLLLFNWLRHNLFILFNKIVKKMNLKLISFFVLFSTLVLMSECQDFSEYNYYPNDYSVGRGLPKRPINRPNGPRRYPRRYPGFNRYYSRSYFYG